MNFINWMNQNKEWLFEGIGVVIVCSFVNVILRRKNSEETKETFSFTFTQTTGNHSHNYQGQTISLTSDSKEKKVDKTK